MRESYPEEERIFDSARQLKDEAVLAAYLERVCHGNSALRARIEALLEADEVRDAKQFGGLGDAQCRVGRAVERQAAFTLGMMSILMGWYLSQGHRTDRLMRRPWYRRKAHPTFQDMLAHARRCSWRQLARPPGGGRVSARSGPGAEHAQTPLRLLRYLEAAA